MGREEFCPATTVPLDDIGSTENIVREREEGRVGMDLP